MPYFSLFFNKSLKPLRSFFARLDEKHKLLEYLRKFWKFLIKIRKIEFLAIFGEFATINSLWK